jgi:hypothetical protein
MTDARFPERWLNDARLQRVSADAYRLYGNALMWCVANRTDGHVPEWALGMIPHAAATVAGELIAVGLWAVHEHDGWIITDFEDTQSSSSDLEVLDNARRRQREKKRRQRAAERSPEDVPGDSPGDSPGGLYPGTNEGTALGQDRLGVLPSSERLSIDNSLTESPTPEPSTESDTRQGGYARAHAREGSPNGETDRRNADYWTTSDKDPFS